MCYICKPFIPTWQHGIRSNFIFCLGCFYKIIPENSSSYFFVYFSLQFRGTQFENHRFTQTLQGQCEASIPTNWSQIGTLALVTSRATLQVPPPFTGRYQALALGMAGRALWWAEARSNRRDKGQSDLLREDNPNESLWAEQTRYNVHDAKKALKIGRMFFKNDSSINRETLFLK